MSDLSNLSPWQKYKQNLGTTRPWDFVKEGTEYASSDISESRLSVCKECPFFISLTSQCTKCGCFMKAKTKLKAATCPEHKW